MVLVNIKGAGTPDPGGLPAMPDVRLNFDDLLSLDAIRAHTKTNDVITVTDEQLRLYRAAAFEACEKYTGQSFTGERWITEIVEQPVWRPLDQFGFPTRNDFVHEAKQPFSKPFGYVYGDGAVTKVALEIGETTVRLRKSVSILAPGDGCCGGCATEATRQLHFGYYSGFSCKEAIPAAFALGALKYIAHVIENPGDMVVATNEAGGRRSGVSIGESSNPAFASGAIPIWRVMMDKAI